jgi:hypothetical protein
LQSYRNLIPLGNLRNRITIQEIVIIADDFFRPCRHKPPVVVVAATAPAAAFCGHPRRRLPAVVVTAAATSQTLAVAAAGAATASRRSTTGTGSYAHVHPARLDMALDMALLATSCYSRPVVVLPGCNQNRIQFFTHSIYVNSVNRLHLRFHYDSWSKHVLRFTPRKKNAFL